MSNKCANCCGAVSQDKAVYGYDNKILLMGNPNVGKSVVFSAMTGVHVMSANYAGTTVGYTHANMVLGDQTYHLIDVPGTYSLQASSQAEAVAVEFMHSGAKGVICVLDATNLTRNLNLAFEVLSFGIPVVFALNLNDVAKRKGIVVDVDKLSQLLGAPVIPTVAVNGTGLFQLKVALQAQMEKSASPISAPATNQECWEQAAQMVSQCVSHTQQAPKLIDRLGDAMIKSWPGLPLAILLMLVSLVLIVFGGKALRVVAFIPMVSLITGFFSSFIGGLGLPTLLENILIGEYGIFIIGFEWPFGLILPYVALFYLVFTFLEDCGILPRMAVLFDNVMRKMGVQGGSFISLMMGFGCAVPAIIGTRSATTQKERIIITSMVCFAVPCISQSGAMITLLASQSIWLLLAMFALAFSIIFTVGYVTGKLLRGTVDPIVIEIPNLLLPEKKAYGKKFWVRMKGFFVEAEGPMLLAVVMASVAKESGLLDMAAVWLEPLISGWLGLPEEAVLFLLLGVVRREMAVAPLLALDLTALQLFVGGTVALLYLPCISVFGVIAKEFNTKVAIAIGVGTFVTALFLGGLINQIGLSF
ncbi:ferrous iron transporter B [Bengtsoniella intestinalis]|uniref:FeoB small GTPase domain-containing protein n=1 Tax=Bengtsoniella intestinalis TaxID=3073143 RepID=UPI00391F1A39